MPLTKSLIEKLAKGDVRMRIPNKDLKRLTRINIALKMMDIFKKHIGRSNSISHAALFRRVFGKTETDSLADELRWEYCKKAMHLLRQRTKCFIGSVRERGTWHYFVVRDREDAQCYIDILENNIKRMRIMQQRVGKAVREEWHRVDWSQDIKQLPYV